MLPRVHLRLTTSVAETAVPYSDFKNAGYHVAFITENGSVPECDRRMLYGWTQTFLGATQATIKAYKSMSDGPEWNHPKSWTEPSFRLEEYDLVFLPGGHDKAVRQLLDSQRAQTLLASYFPLTKKPCKKVCAAICHGVQALAHTKTEPDSTRSILHDVTTTALTAFMEASAYHSSRLFLGDYYKTYGAGTKNVEDFVKKGLANPQTQWKGSANVFKSFVVEDENYNYISARFPGDAPAFSHAIIKLVGTSKGYSSVV